jgi:hypothetical protein
LRPQAWLPLITVLRNGPLNVWNAIALQMIGTKLQNQFEWCPLA